MVQQPFEFGKQSITKMAKLVEIAKALSQNARILILDEPTSSLTARETETLLKTVLDLRSQGVSVIYISHRLGEIGQVADRVAALRDGKNAGDLSRKEINHDNMVKLMIGRSLKNFLRAARRRRDRPAAAWRFKLRLKTFRSVRTSAIDLEARGGRDSGRGRTGRARGARKWARRLIFECRPAHRLARYPSTASPCAAATRSVGAIEAGIYLVPEDRRKTGLVTEMTIRENITLPGPVELHGLRADQPPERSEAGARSGAVAEG